MSANQASAPTTDRGITVERLTRRFGNLVAVDQVDLRVESGEIFGFLGPNGAGKSTLVKMLTTILAPTSGRATVGGHDVTRHQHRVRELIGVALQDVGLDPLMTGPELLRLQAELFGEPAGLARHTATRLLSTVGLERVDPRKRVGDYSGGMKRRLDLALALAHDPQVLFLDEPTTGLDPASRVDIWDEVRRLNREQGMTIFLTTQYLEEADRLADRVAIIDHGRIVALGAPTELKRGLGDEVVELDFDSPAAAARATETLAEAAPRCRQSGDGVRCYLPAAAPAVPTIVRALDQASIALRGLTVSQPTLDDVFLRVTGKSLGAEEGLAAETSAARAAKTPDRREAKGR